MSPNANTFIHTVRSTPSMAAALKHRVDLADVIKVFGERLLESQRLSPQQVKALYHIVHCRTSTLGGHKEVCDQCGASKFSYNSCGDRHCPKCQHLKQIAWVEKLQAEVLPIKHFHIIFTLPHCLNEVCLWNKKQYYGLMFHAVWQTLRSFGYTHFGVESGVIAVLHTWGQNLSLHPHIHCIVPAAGYSLRGKWKRIGNSDRYLYPVAQLSAVFKGKFLDSLKRRLKKMKHSGFNEQIQQAYDKTWTVFCEAPMAGVTQIIKYLGQYTHRIAISNQRIKSIEGDKVLFYAKDYRDNATVKSVQMDGVEFLRRFVMHILPKGFIRIRRYGIYHPTTKRNLDLQFTDNKMDLHEMVEMVEMVEQVQKDKAIQAPPLHRCPVCKKGNMRVVEEIPRIRSPARHLPTLLIVALR